MDPNHPHQPGVNPYVAPQHQGYTQPPAYQKSGRGGLVLALGILSLTTSCFILGIIAWVMGNNDLADMDAGVMNPTERGLTNAGRIIGMISTILAIIGIGFFILIIALSAATTTY